MKIYLYLYLIKDVIQNECFCVVWRQDINKRFKDKLK